MKNTIADRVADFLKRFPPFDLLSAEELHGISMEVKIIHVEKSTIVYSNKDALHDHFYVINKGSISLKKEIGGGMRTVDKFDEGDLFGLRPVFAREHYKVTANADEESILYAIPIKVFKPLAKNNRKVGTFLIESFASNSENPYTHTHLNELFSEDDAPNVVGELFDMQPAAYVKKVVTAKAETMIKDIAALMSQHNIRSVIIEKNHLPLGIITDKDLRDKVATGLISINAPAKSIMGSPVLCYPKTISIAQAQMAMMKHRVGHLCITKDGTPNTKIIGVLSHHDVIVMKGNNPDILMKAIKRANSTKQLKRVHEKVILLLDGYMRQNFPIGHTSKIIFELNDATIKRVLERCLEKMGTPPPVKFAWLSLGSQGRKEQLLRTDQDNAIVFEDVPGDRLDEVRAYFLTLAKKVTKRLDKIGFEFCPADIMAKNPKWCLSKSEWKQQYSKWTTETGSDEILLCSIFFDLDISYGDPSLSNALLEHILKITRDNSLFISKLAASALRNPSPFGIFRTLLVEQDGAYKDQFNLKQRGLMPITDAARVLALHYQIKNITNTADRFDKLAELVPENKEFYTSCAYASKALLKFKTKNGLWQNDSGSFIDLTTLTKADKMKLKRCFKTIVKVQELIKYKFAVT